MSRISGAIALITVALAVLGPATAAAGAALGHHVRACPAVPAQVKVTATIAAGSQAIGVAKDRRSGPSGGGARRQTHPLLAGRKHAHG